MKVFRVIGEINKPNLQTPFVKEVGEDIVAIQAKSHGWDKKQYLDIVHS